MLKIGSEAPDFSVPLHTGEIFRLSDQHGRNRVILYFYPKDFTAGCTAQACMFSEHFREITALDVVIIGISADNMDSHRKFAAAHNLQFPLGSDEKRSVMKLYEALRFGIMPLRVTYIIDKAGVIRGAAHHELLIDRHWQSVITVLSQIGANE